MIGSTDEWNGKGIANDRWVDTFLQPSACESTKNAEKRIISKGKKKKTHTVDFYGRFIS